MITSIVPLGEVVERGFRKLMENRDGHVKVLVKPISIDMGEDGERGGRQTDGTL